MEIGYMQFKQEKYLKQAIFPFVLITPTRTPLYVP